MNINEMTDDELEKFLVDARHDSDEITARYRRDIGWTESLIARIRREIEKREAKP